MDDIFQSGLHEFLEDFVGKNNSLSRRIARHLQFPLTMRLHVRHETRYAYEIAVAASIQRLTTHAAILRQPEGGAMDDRSAGHGKRARLSRWLRQPDLPRHREDRHESVTVVAGGIVDCVDSAGVVRGLFCPAPTACSCARLRRRSRRRKSGRRGSGAPGRRRQYAQCHACAHGCHSSSESPMKSGSRMHVRRPRKRSRLDAAFARTMPMYFFPRLATPHTRALCHRLSRHRGRRGGDRGACLGGSARSRSRLGRIRCRQRQVSDGPLCARGDRA